MTNTCRDHMKLMLENVFTLPRHSERNSSLADSIGARQSTELYANKLSEMDVAVTVLPRTVHHAKVWQAGPAHRHPALLPHPVPQVCKAPHPSCSITFTPHSSGRRTARSVREVTSSGCSPASTTAPAPTGSSWSAPTGTPQPSPMDTMTMDQVGGE